ncbi:MAG: hypothetical protein ACPG4N_04810 [Gammaproteobacteria bacterium]
MGVLSAQELVQSVRNARPLTPFSIEWEALERQVERLMETREVMDSDGPLTERLFERIDEQLGFLSPVRREALARHEVYVVPLPLCLAFSHEMKGRKIIVIGEGLINLIANTIWSSNLQALLPESLDSAYFLAFRRDMPVSHIVTNALFLMDLHFYRTCAPQLNTRPLIPEDMLAQSEDAIRGAIVFILMHELGHHELGHLDDQVRPMRYEFLIDEAMSTEQQQEMEADTYALESLINQARVLGGYWHGAAINFFMQMELVSGSRFDTAHPASIDRAFYSDAKRVESGQGHDVSPRPAFYEELAARFRSSGLYLRDGSNPFLETSRDGCLRLLKEANAVLAPFGVDISPIWGAEPQGWLD